MTSSNQTLTAKQRLLKLKKSMLARIIDRDEEFQKNNDVPNDSHYRFEAIKQKTSIFLIYFIKTLQLASNGLYLSSSDTWY